MSTGTLRNVPFSTAHMRLHICNQHKEKWKEYQNLSDEKMEYFTVTIPDDETLVAHFGSIE